MSRRRLPLAPLRGDISIGVDFVKSLKQCGDPGWIRTTDLQLRRLLLYPLSYGADVAGCIAVVPIWQIGALPRSAPASGRGASRAAILPQPGPPVGHDLDIFAH